MMWRSCAPAGGVLTFVMARGYFTKGGGGAVEDGVAPAHLEPFEALAQPGRGLALGLDLLRERGEACGNLARRSQGSRRGLGVDEGRRGSKGAGVRKRLGEGTREGAPHQGREEPAS